MHELAVTQNILEIALKHGSLSRASRITDLYIVIGQLSSIIDDSVQFFWDLVAKETIAEGARLHFIRLPVKLQCKECNYEFELPNDQYVCPKCQQGKIKIVSGDEFYLESIEIEV